MHEFSLLANLLKKIDHIVEQNGNPKVKEVKVMIGALGHISPEHFTEHFDHAVKGTPLADAKLSVRLDDDPKAPHAQEIILEKIEVEA